ncbi:MAG: OmpA family protein [Proteobacteria bacterium]|nr:OmpA family protein [Pseudomonadota bacterium]
MASNEFRPGRKNHLFKSVTSVTSVKPALTAGVFLGVFALGACAQVPDALDPASWYKSTVDLFAGEEAEKKKEGRESALAADRGKPPPGADKAFPNLASVDEMARRRDKTGGGLAADPDRPKYAPAIRRQGAASDTLRAAPVPAPIPQPAIAAPPPSAAPMAPVTTMPTAPAPGRPPAPATIPKLELPAMTAEQRDDQDRLARQLAEIRARAEAPGDLPANAQLPAAPGELATIVISSQGIETIGAMAAAEATLPAVATPPRPPAASRLMESRAALAAPGRTVKVATILFDNGSSKLKAHDKRILRAITRLQRKNGGKLRIVGHASARTRNLPPVKHKMANFQVSVARADSVVSELVRMGVKEEDIQIAAMSDAKPIYYEFMPSGEAGNRRTEVYLTN